MIQSAISKRRALFFGVQSRVCAVELTNVIEIMRPLPIEPVPGVPPFVLGVSIIRGLPTPVVDLGAVLGKPLYAADRFVTLRMGGRQVALAVSAVLGVHELDPTLPELPALLQGAPKDIIESISALDEQVFVILRGAWVLPEQVWQTLSTREVVA